MTSPTQSREGTFGSYLRLLARRKGVILLMALGVAAAALAVSLVQTRIYEASAHVLLDPHELAGSSFTSNNGAAADPVRRQQTAIQVLLSQQVRAGVQKRLGESPDISVAPIGQSDVVAIKVTNTDGRRAAKIANAYAAAFIDLIRDQQTDAETAAKQVLSGLQQQIDTLSAEIATEVNSAPPDQRALIASQRGNELNALIAQQSALAQQLNQRQADSAANPQLISPARPPDSPIKPTPLQNTLLGFAVGLVLGIGAVLLLDSIEASRRPKVPGTLQWSPRHDSSSMSPTPAGGVARGEEVRSSSTS